jgi:maltooligosyltrehalose trehalohydrolase
MLGERLSSLVSFECLKLAASVVLLSPYVPLIFMGEEYGESAPFLYFVHHENPDLVESVRRGRREEFKSFQSAGEPPDPQSEKTFYQSKIEWQSKESGSHRILLDYYKELIHLRREIPALSNCNKEQLDVWGLEGQRILFMERGKDESRIFSVFNLGPTEKALEDRIPEGRWRKRVDSSEARWNGPGTALPERTPPEGEIRIQGYSFVLYLQEGPQ